MSIEITLPHNVFGNTWSKNSDFILKLQIIFISSFIIVFTLMLANYFQTEMDVLKVVGLHELRSLNTWKGAAAESLGACFYVMLACGAGSNIADGHSPTILQKAITTGFVVTIMVSAFWEVSGGHINPAVSLASTLCGKISITRFFLYVIAQCAGSK